MSTSGTYDFNPSIAEMVIAAFARIQIRRSELLAEHMQDARMAANLIFSRWATKNGPNLWKVELQTVPLLTGVSNYTLDKRVIGVLDAYIEQGSPPQDRIIYSVSRSDYAAFPDKTTQGIPTVFWFDRTITPSITVWQPPNDNITLKLYTVSQIQDAGLASGQQGDLPYRFLAAFVSALAAELALIYRLEAATALRALADQDWNDAASADYEDAPMFITPGLSAYRTR